MYKLGRPLVVNVLLSLSLFLLAACGNEGHKPKPSLSSSEKLARQVVFYQEEIPQFQDAYGFIHTDRCDATLFSGLLAASGMEVDMEAAEASPGQWLRRPASYSECFSEGRSRSTISRDSLLGVMWWAWRAKRLDVLERIYAYGESNSWVMGDGRSAGVDTIFLPAYIGLLAQLIEKLGGESRPIASALPETLTECEAYSCHIQSLRLLLRAEVNGSMPSNHLETIQNTHKRYPENALFSYIVHRYTDGDFSEAIDLLLKHYPADRMPTSQDYCASWPMQENGGELNWLPCDKKEIRTGADFLFTAMLMEDVWETPGN